MQGGSISMLSQQQWSKNGWNWCRTSVRLLWKFVWQAAYLSSIEVIGNRKPWHGYCYCLSIYIPSAWELITSASFKWQSGFQKWERWNASSTCDVSKGCGWMCSIAEASSWIIMSWMIRLWLLRACLGLCVSWHIQDPGMTTEHWMKWKQ